MLVLAFIETATVGLLAFYAAAVSDPASSFNLRILEALRGISFLLPFVLSPKAMIATLSVLVIVSLPIKNAFRGWVVYQIACCGATMEAILGERLLDVVLSQDYAWHMRQNSSDLIQTLNWRHHVGRFFIQPYLSVVSEVSLLVVLLCGLLLVQPVISLLFIAGQAGAGILVYKILRRGLDTSASGCCEHEKAMNRYIAHSIQGVKDVKMTGTAGYFLTGFKRHAKIFAGLFGSQRFWQESPLLALETLGFVTISGAILFMLFVLNYSPLQTTGTTALLAVTAWRTLPAFSRVVSSLAGIRTSRPYVLSLFEVLDRMPEVNRMNKLADDGALPFEKDVRLEKVCFSYEEGRSVLKDFSLTLVKGQSLGIMGPSGCGKSTIVDLLTGLLTPQQGRILVDGITLSVENLNCWRYRIGYVPQFPYILDGTLAENVAFGVVSNQIDEKRIIESCKMAAVDFLPQLPEGIHTPIGERGVRLSGGQQQRIAIARALYRQPEVLVFDEATSALDEVKDSEIKELISKLSGGKTLVVVSHRKSTIENCDLIYFFD